jgi:protein SCO1/2
MNKKFFWVVTGSLLVVILAAVIATIINNRSPAYYGSVIDPASPAPDFSLTDQNGQTFNLSALRGKYVLLFFGYTQCTNECPATMAILAQARRLLDQQAGEVQVMFVSTDPARDTPQAIGEFLNRFDPSFIGVTGTQAQLQPVWAAYGVSVEDGGETHSSYVYLIDTTGNLRMTYPFPSTAEGISSDLKQLMRKN